MHLNSDLQATIEHFKNGLNVPAEIVRRQLLDLDPFSRQKVVSTIARAIFDSSTLGHSSSTQFHTLETEYGFRAKHMEWDIQVQLLALIAPVGQAKSHEKIVSIVNYTVDYTAEKDPNMLEALVQHAQALGQPTEKFVKNKVWELAINDMLMDPEYNLAASTQKVPQLLERTADWTQHNTILDLLRITADLAGRISMAMGSGYLQEKEKHRKLTQQTLLTLAQKGPQDVSISMTDTLGHIVEQANTTQMLLEVLVEHGANWEQVSDKARDTLDEEIFSSIERHPNVRKVRLEQVAQQHRAAPGLRPNKRSL